MGHWNLFEVMVFCLVVAFLAWILIPLLPFIIAGIVFYGIYQYLNPSKESDHEEDSDSNGYLDW